MKIFIREIKPGNHTELITAIESENIPQVNDYLQILINNDKVYKCQVCSVHRCYWYPGPEMLSSVILKVRKT